MHRQSSLESERSTCMATKTTALQTVTGKFWRGGVRYDQSTAAPRDQRAAKHGDREREYVLIKSQRLWIQPAATITGSRKSKTGAVRVHMNEQRSETKNKKGEIWIWSILHVCYASGGYVFCGSRGGWTEFPAQMHLAVERISQMISRPHTHHFLTTRCKVHLLWWPLIGRKKRCLKKKNLKLYEHHSSPHVGWLRLRDILHMEGEEGMFSTVRREKK